ncbi:hypothetical protein [Kutzneria sp. 744]|uniref:hypothetical protein n=1 Tax=Kutzneria sp. (strain 744) TaxID=345341 RepID=UPI0004B7EDCE|nr:hypothetical protein [Kutzneria sp. 744]
MLPVAGAARRRRGRLVTVAGQVACNPDAGIHAPGDPDGQAVYVFASMREALLGVVEIARRCLGTIRRARRSGP